jgi:hypothetical protein
MSDRIWPTRVQTSGETLMWQLGVSSMLATGVTIVSTGTARLIDKDTGLTYDAGLLDNSSASGTNVRQKVRSLVVGKRYLLLIPFTDSGGNVQEAGLNINVDR